MRMGENNENKNENNENEDGWLWKDEIWTVVF